VKRLILSVSITLIVFSSAYFLFERGLIQAGGGRIKDLAGKNIREEYILMADTAASGLKRFISITDRKLDYLASLVDLDDLLLKKNGKKSGIIFQDFVTADPYCERIRIINRNLDIVYSTAQGDVRGSKLNQDMYGKALKGEPEDESAVIVDPVAERLIFYRPVRTGSGKRYILLFYYNQNALDNSFNAVRGFDYSGFLITTGKVVLVNFPEIETEEERNLSELLQAIAGSTGGAVRVLLKGSDKTIYYKKLSGPHKDWTVGLTFDTEHLRISGIGTVILIVQALVVFSVVIFVLISLRSRRVLSSRALRADRAIREPLARAEAAQSADAAASDAGGEGVPAAAPAEAVPAAVSAEGAAGARSGEAGAAALSEEIPEMPVTETGVLPLSDVEEITEVEEIGEAEVAEDIGGGAGEEIAEGAVEETAEEAVEGLGVALGKKTAEEALEAEAEEAEAAAEPPEEERVSLETIIDDLKRIPDRLPQEKREAGTLPELEKLVSAGRFDDELSRLIRKIEGEKPKDLESTLKESLDGAGLKKGALLFKREGGTYTPEASAGLSKKTADALIFMEGEKIVSSFLKKGKTLFVSEDVGRSRELMSKFSQEDAAAIDKLLISPIMVKEKLCAIVLLCMASDEVISQRKALEAALELRKAVEGWLSRP